MAARFIHLLCVSRTVFMIICSLLGTTNGASHDVVYTDSHKNARKGDELILKCDFSHISGNPIGIYWKTRTDPSWEPDLNNLNDDPPSLIEKVDDKSSGSCNQDMSCYMNSNFSLVIKSLQIDDQAIYFCVIANSLLGLIFNKTTVSVFAPPMEPAPVISECRGLHPNDICTMSTSAGTNITCSASSYFPDIDMFFLQGSKKMDNTNSEEVINPDGTKNKSISVLAEPSETPYVCVASDIPGSQDQRTVSIEVNSAIGTTVTTIPSQTNVPGSSVAKVVVPVVIVIILMLIEICFVVLWWRRRKQRRTKDDPEAMPLNETGKISFYELWYLVQNMDATDLQKLKDGLIALNMAVDKVPTQNKAYELLCEWKDRNTSDNEGRRLHNTLFGYGLGGPLKRMTERRNDGVGIPISEERLDYIVQKVVNGRDLDRFLRELGLISEQQESQLKMKENRDDFVKEAMEELMKWRETKGNGSHFILLSLALERANCRPLDRTFFKAPEHLLKPISPQEVKRFVYGLTGRQCRRLGEAVGITDEKRIAAIIDENNEDLFDTQAMISDWIAEQECSNYEKRCMLDDAVIKIGRHDMADAFGTTSYRFEAGDTLERPHRYAKAFYFGSIFDDDLMTLLKHLPSNAIRSFLEKLFNPVDKDMKEDDVEEKLRGWRDESMAQSRAISLQKLCSIHKDVLKDLNYSKGHDVKDDELENVLESITSAERMKQLIAGLGISHDGGQSHLQRLKGWRDKCPIEKRRKTLRKTLNVLGLSVCIVDQLPPIYVYQAEMVRFAYHILCSDVEQLATLLRMDTSKVKTVREPLKGTVGLLIQLLNKSKMIDRHRRLDFSRALRDLGYLDVARSAYFGYEASLSELYNMTSGLSKDEMEKLIDHLQVDKQALTTTGLHDNLDVMNVWRNQRRPEPIHFRLKLALGLRAVGRDERADDILAGRFRTMEVCSDVVEKICDSLDGQQMEGLCNHLKLNIKKARDDQTTATLVAEWVRNWLQKFDKITFKTLISKDKLIPRAQENDKLFRAGFFELAEEIMLLEVSKSISVKPVNQEFDEIADEGDAEGNPESTERVETLNGDQAEVRPISTECDHCDEASRAQEPTGGSAQVEGEEALNMPTENTQLIANITHDPSESSV